MSRSFYIIVSIGLLLTAGIVAFRIHATRTSEEESVYVPRQEVITPEVELLREYVRIDTSNPPGNETAGAKFLIDFLARNGIAAELIEPLANRGSVYARIKGRRAGEGLLLLHHIDVYPASPSGWTREPFAAEVFLNQLWGRGALDMKSIAICHLLAFVDVAKSGKPPERDIVLLAAADEEAGSSKGVGWLVEHRPDIFEGIQYAINEGGTTEMRAERVSYFGVEIGSKIFTRLRLRALSREPLEQARIAMEPLFRPYEAERILPEVREYFRSVAPYRVELANLFADIDKTISEGRFWNLPPGFRTLTQNNLVAAGIVRDGDRFALDVILQNLPNEDPEARILRFRRSMEPFDVSIEVMQRMDRSRIVSTRTPFFTAMKQAVKHEYGDVPVGPAFLGYGTTDCRYLRARGIDCYGFFPFPVDFFQTQGIHGIDERVTLGRFLKGVSLTKTLVRRWTATTDN